MRKAMALNFSGLFSRREQNTTGVTGAAKAAPVSDTAHTRYAEQMKYVKPGQTLSGEVVARNGSEVQIRLDQDTVINARLERDLNLAVGQNMTFEVQSLGSSAQRQQIALRPLYENLTQDANVLKALNAASIPLSDKTAGMVALLMKEGMSIDISSLQNLYRDINTFPKADVQDLVALHKLGIEVGEESLRQIAGYRNMEYQILQGIETLTEEASDTLLGLVETSPGEAGRLLYDMLQIFGQNGTGAESVSVQNREAPLQNMEVQSREASSEGLSVESQGALSGQATADGAVVFKTRQEMTVFQETLLQLLPEESERAAFAERLFDMGADTEKASLVKNGQIGLQELSNLVAEVLTRGNFSKRALRALLGNSGMKTLLQNRMEGNWLLRTDEKLDQEAVEKLYSRISEQTERLGRALSAAGAEEGSMAKSVQQVRESVDFLNQLNQTYTYVQLPLKMTGQKAHGDLYVYTNKKNLAKRDGTVSALLHLDMEHLGSMDIYVAMNQEHVSTKFYLEREELLDFLEQHMYILTEHLNRRGYRMDYEVLQHDKPVKLVDEMMKQEGSASVLTQYSFDVRA
ncbi:MAG: flagellar hook-length control protein FliK [Lachnospiraceae bacterium]|nr:flagellar hook-length control protein FliK [Lachnospiraceae bacterium]